MDATKTGALIRKLRLERQMTQLALADKLHVSDKAVSKWERGLGCPDISLLTALSETLGINLPELLSGTLESNDPVGGNMKKLRFYVCPQCGNLITAAAEAVVSCCGKTLQPLEMRKAEPEERLTVEIIENEYFVTTEHEMTKEHALTFVALLTGDSLVLRKLYPEWNVQARLPQLAHGLLVWHCNRHGLMYQPV